MPFKPGQKKIGGRKAGTPNKKSLRDVYAMAEAKGVEPFEVLLDLCKERDPSIRLGAAKEAAKYMYTQKRAVEVAGKDGGPLKAEVESSAVQDLLADFRAMLHTKISERKG